MLRIVCQQCGQKLRLAKRPASGQVTCPRCQARVAVPPEKQRAKSAVTESDPLLFPKSAHSAGAERPEEMIDMTAMVDIVFFLLIFFMVTSINSKQASIALPNSPPTPPTAAPAGTVVEKSPRRSVEEYEEDEEFIVVKIEEDNTVWVDEEETTGPQDVLNQLRKARDEAPAGKESPSKVLVLGNAASDNATAVMVLDAAHEVGLDDVRLAVSGGDEEDEAEGG